MAVKSTRLLPYKAESWLAPRVRKFVEEYAKDHNCERAVIAAGYDNENPRRQAYLLLKRTEVKAALDKLQREADKLAAVRLADVLREIKALAFYDPKDLFEDDGSVKPVSQWPEGARKAVSSLDVAEIFSGQGDDKQAIGLAKKIRFNDKTKALDMLMKHLGAYAASQVELTGAGGGPLDIQVSFVQPKLAVELDGPKIISALEDEAS